MSDYKNLIRLIEATPFEGGIDPPAQLPERRTINVHGREEHEAILRDPKKCEELGIDRVLETVIYLKRWGSWL